mmetsp:Transcript_5406/g.12515  ORF Transcript_5406/g.12515 Transcript_5406/m.12515 type:complete len:474 (+) Transcript_5406:174-1595(+)
MHRSPRVSSRLQSGRSPAAPATLTLLLSLLFATAAGFAPAVGGGARTSAATELRSVPGPLDTLTSGLASIVRIQNGVTVSTRAIGQYGPARKFLPTVKRLYDVENDRDCRLVRERVTELDLVVERVIPACDNSRAASEDPDLVVPTLVADEDGDEVTVEGAGDILRYLNDKFTVDGEEDGGPAAGSEEDAVGELLNTLSTYLPGYLRAGRGAAVTAAAVESPVLGPVPRPDVPLVLYGYEGNQFCRLVREVLTELDLTYELRCAGKGSKRRDELADVAAGQKATQPFLVDPNTKVKMAESKDIVEYLYERYARWTPPSAVLGGLSSVVTPLLRPVYGALAPVQAGSTRDDTSGYDAEISLARAEIYEEISRRTVVVYTYDLSPFCSEATDLLRSAGIKFREVSLGSEWLPGLLREPAKRAALLEITGQSSLPHVFVGGESIGGLYSGSPGLLEAMESGRLQRMVEEAREAVRS